MLYRRVFTYISRQLKAAMSTPVESCPDSSACTSVVPEPAKGSSTRPPTVTCRRSNSSTSCGMNLPRYGCRRWTCFVRTSSGRSLSDHESSRSISEYSASWVGATAPNASTPPLERLRHALEPAAPLGDDVEADLTAAVLRMRRQPRERGDANSPYLLRRHHLERVAVAIAALSFHLDEDNRAPAADDEVELVPADPDVRAEDAVETNAVVPKRSVLGRVPQVRRPSCRRGRATSGGGSDTGRARGRCACAPA